MAPPADPTARRTRPVDGIDVRLVVGAIVVSGVGGLICGVGLLVPLPDWLVILSLLLMVVGALIAGVDAWRTSVRHGVGVWHAIRLASRVIVRWFIFFLP